MAKALKLAIKPNYDFTLVGIVTSEPIYRLAWLINQELQINLSEAPVVKIYNAKKSILQDFPFFSELVDDVNAFELVANRGPHGLLVEEQKQVDFFFKIYDDLVDLDAMLVQLKNIKNISLALKIEPGSLKSKDRLVFSIEED